MKNFFTSMLGALAALVLFSGGCAVLMFVFLALLAAVGGGEKGAPTFERGAYLVLDLSSRITDAPAPIDFGAFGGKSDALQLRTVTRALKAAAKDERIAGVYVSGDLSLAALGSGYASLREVRDALREVKDAGKPVVAYLTYATTKSYYVASAATELALDPYGVIAMPGLSTEPMFFAGAFQKYGVNVQVTRVGKYKSAVEPFTRKDMSPENREEVQRLLDDVWADLLADIGPSRKLTPQQIQGIVDAEGLIRPKVALEKGIVDRIAYRDEIYDALKEKTGRKGTKEPFKQVRLEDYAKMVPDNAAHAKGGGLHLGGKGEIAVVYAEGDIVDGEGETDEVGGTKFSRLLRKLRQDEDVKAIVLRVNSPGGSASASEVIQREIRLIKKVKPIVISMGNYAASGGYWISTYGDRIYAEPTTITGSIGVFGIQFDVQRLANDFGITFDNVKTGKFAGALTVARAKTPEELAVFQRMVDWIYGEFVTKVAESRQIDPAKVEEIAQGRVWSGVEAKKLGLVDEIGGLDDAIAYAAEKADLGTNYKLIEYPRQKELFEAIQEMLEKAAPGFTSSRSVAGKIAERVEAELKTLRSFNDPKGVYARMPLTLSVK